MLNFAAIHINNSSRFWSEAEDESESLSLICAFLPHWPRAPAANNINNHNYLCIESWRLSLL